MSERRPSFDAPRDVPSYDEKQAAAVSIRCAICGERHDCTDHDTRICSDCQRERWTGVQGGDEEDM